MGRKQDYLEDLRDVFFQHDCFSQNFAEGVKCSQLKEVTAGKKGTNKNPKIEIQNLQNPPGIEKPGPFFWWKLNRHFSHFLSLSSSEADVALVCLLGRPCP